MPPKKKRNVVTEKGPINIVGVNHGVCLAIMFSEEWEHETFSDVTFYCKPSKNAESRKHLRANRSVLAAASPLFASMLPQGELETDVCVTVEETYQDMFSVLDYIYSGNILCELKDKKHLLHILKEFQIGLPNQKLYPRLPTKEVMNTTFLSSAAVEPTRINEGADQTSLNLDLSLPCVPLQETYHYHDSLNEETHSLIELEPPSVVQLPIATSSGRAKSNLSSLTTLWESDPKLQAEVRVCIPKLTAEELLGANFSTKSSRNSRKKGKGKLETQLPRVSTPKTSTLNPIASTPKPSTITPIVSTPKTTTITSIVSKPKTSTITPIISSPKTSTIPLIASSPKTSTIPLIVSSPKPSTKPLSVSSPKPSTIPLSVSSPKSSTIPLIVSSPKTSSIPPLVPISNTSTIPPLVPISKTSTIPPLVPISKTSTIPLIVSTPKTSTIPLIVSTPKTSTIPLIVSTPKTSTISSVVSTSNTSTISISKPRLVSSQPEKVVITKSAPTTINQAPPPEFNVVIQRVTTHASLQNAQKSLPNNSLSTGRDLTSNLQAIRLDANSDFVLWVAPPDESQTIAAPTDKDSVTFTFPNIPEKSKIPYPLSRYHSDTWCHGIYSPFEYRTPVPYIQMGRTEQEIQEMSKDRRFPQWTLKPPNFLLEKPESVYTRKRTKNSSEEPRILAKRYRQDPIERSGTTKTFNGKTHVTLKGEPLPRPPTLPNIFVYKEVDVPAPEGFKLPANTLMTEFVLIDIPEITKGETKKEVSLKVPMSQKKTRDEEEKLQNDSNDDESCCVELEVDLLNPDTEDTHQDMVDLAMAKHFLEEESRKRNTLQNRIRGFNDSLKKHKKVARDLLKAKEERELRKIEEAFEAERYRSNPKARKRGPFEKCDQCGKMIASNYMKHHKKLHTSTKSHLCEQCGRSFMVKAYLNNHIRINHSNRRTKNYMCATCGSRFPDRYKLEKHELIHTDVKPFECEFCDKSFREKGTLTRHIRTHTGERPYICNVCGAAFRARFTYNEHYKRLHMAPISSDDPREVDEHSNQLVYRCEHCDKIFHRLLTFEKHKATHTGEPVALRCVQNDCDFTYSTMTEIKEHLAAAHPNKSYPCSLCSKIFLSKLSLRNHQTKHEPHKGFSCSQCDAVMTTKSSLITHEKIHNREENLECPTCGSRHHSAFMMRRHMATHKPTYRKRIRIRKKKEHQEVEQQQQQPEIMEQLQELVDSGTEDSNPPDVIVEFY